MAVNFNILNKNINKNINKNMNGDNYNNDNYDLDDLDSLSKDIMILKTMNYDSSNMDVDQAIIKETNTKLLEIERDFNDLCDAVKIMNELIGLDQEKLDYAESNLVEVDNTILETLPILEEAYELKNKMKNKYLTVKIISGATIGGIVIGSIGSVFGIIPGIIGLSVGTGSGGLIGYLTKFF